MIPQKIQLKNFLSYGPNLQTIDFSNYSLICLSGKNGHGKSALLDAMTWALWGQARKIAGATKADQGLLRLGQTQMLVVFDFLFGGKKYRIRREYMETYGKPINVLEFGMIDDETDTFIPLTDKTIRTTQDKIEQTLRIDFDSFSNSAFLRQGSSNEFSKKSPKDRKQILATILGLDQYEVIRKLALEKTKDAQAKKTALITLQEKRTQELAAQETLDAERTRLATELLIAEQQEKQLAHDQRMYAQTQQQYHELQKQFHNFSFQLKQLTQQAESHKKQIREQLCSWRTVNKKKRTLQSAYVLDQEKNNIIAAITHHQKLLQENLEHRQTLLNVTQQLTAIEQEHKDIITKKNHILQLELERLKAEYKNHQQLIITTQTQIAHYNKEIIECTAQRAQHEQELAALQQHPDELAHHEAQLEKRKAMYQNFVSLGNWINSELNSLANKKKLVHKDDPACPLCEQNLSASRKKFLKLNFEKQESFLIHRLQRLKRIIPALKEILINQHATITKHKESLQLTTSIQSKIMELVAVQTKLTEQITQLTTTYAQQEKECLQRGHNIATKQQEILDHTTIPAPIHNEQYVLLSHQKQSLEQKVREHVYKEDDYKRDQERLKVIELQHTEYETIQKDMAQQESRKHDIQKLCVILKQSTQEIYQITAQRTALGDLEAQSALLNHQEKSLEQQRSTLNHSKEGLLHAQGSIENQQKYLSKVKAEFTEELVVIAQLQNMIDDYQTIATATGKDGIQALLIEEAIPEIEQEANYLLSRLTNNQAQIFIESLRDLKKGGTKETLDIKISDQAGIRPYELFSGGEAFRIDFALRIAISKLLARRAGTALQILIIDEGFGSQDEEGLGHIMDVLHKIQDDFSKIIIVSHLPSMKDQFPVQFLIEKGVQGSTVQVFEQG